MPKKPTTPREILHKRTKHKPSRTHTTSHTHRAHNAQSPHKPPTLTIIGGKWRGLKLRLPESTSLATSTQATKDTLITRPTKAIVRESCLNSLADIIYGSCFIEGFAGSGSMGIEALSWGASVGVFCEQDSHAIATLEQNLNALKGSLQIHHIATSLQSIPQIPQISHTNPLARLQAHTLTPTHATLTQSAYIVRGDSFVNLPLWLSCVESHPIRSILYLDPPFCIRENYADIYEKCAKFVASITHSKLSHIIIEHSSAYRFPEILGQFVAKKSKRFGKSTLTYFIQGD